MFFAVLISLVGVGILAWQYRQLEEEKIPALEEKMEQRLVRDVLDDFMAARIEKSEAKALRYLTENSMEQQRLGEFSLIGSFESYQVLSSEKLGENEYRYTVKIYEDKTGERVEVITLTKISDSYYINSVQMAG